MRRIEVKAERLALIHRRHPALRRCHVERYFSRMHYQRKDDAFAIEYVENRPPTLRKVVIAILDLMRRRWRKGIHHRPDTASREPVHDNPRQKILHVARRGV